MSGTADAQAGLNGAKARRTRLTLIENGSSLPVRPRISVLYVEDDADDVYIVKRYLSRIPSFDVDIVHAANLADAHDLASRRQFDVVLCDFWLGCETTLPLIDQLRDDVRAIPVILVSSLDNSDIELIGRRAGVAGFVAKDDLSSASLDRLFNSLLPEEETMPVNAQPGIAAWLRDLLASIDKVQSAATMLATETTDQARILIDEVLAPTSGLREELQAALLALEVSPQQFRETVRFNAVPYLMDAVKGLSTPARGADIRIIEPAFPILVEANPALFTDLISGFFAEAADIVSAGIPICVVPSIQDGKLSIVVSAAGKTRESIDDPKVAAAASIRRLLVETLAVTGGGSARFSQSDDNLMIGSLEIPLRRQNSEN